MVSYITVYYIVHVYVIVYLNVKCCKYIFVSNICEIYQCEGTMDEIIDLVGVQSVDMGRPYVNM